MNTNKYKTHTHTLYTHFSNSFEEISTYLPSPAKCGTFPDWLHDLHRRKPSPMVLMKPVHTYMYLKVHTIWAGGPASSTTRLQGLVLMVLKADFYIVLSLSGLVEWWRRHCLQWLLPEEALGPHPQKAPPGLTSWHAWHEKYIKVVFRQTCFKRNAFI